MFAPSVSEAIDRPVLVACGRRARVPWLVICARSDSSWWSPSAGRIQVRWPTRIAPHSCDNEIDSEASTAARNMLKMCWFCTTTLGSLLARVRAAASSRPRWCTARRMSANTFLSGFLQRSHPAIPATSCTRLQLENLQIRRPSSAAPPTAPAPAVVASPARLHFCVLHHPNRSSGPVSRPGGCR